jgi:hypothetical protein
MKRRDLAVALLFAAVALMAAFHVEAAVVGADAVVLVNSQSPRYLDFKQRIQPYLDNFGVPYTVEDISTNGVGTNIEDHALIIIGHSQLDTSQTYLTAAAQQNISLAVSNGTGLVSFDNVLSTARGTPLYQYEQNIFGFTYGGPVSANEVTTPATLPGSVMHYITARHTAGGSITFSNSVTFTNLTLPLNTNESAIALLDGGPFVVVQQQYGQGRAVQWMSYDWMAEATLGPLTGMDDLLWRGMVWSARKPFVMRGLPNFLSFRMDDVSGPQGPPYTMWWVRTANQMGIKVWLGLFMDDFYTNDTLSADVAALAATGSNTVAVHSLDCCNTFFPWDHCPEGPLTDAQVSNNFANATQWFTNYHIPISTVVGPHYSEIGSNTFPYLAAWGVQYIGQESGVNTVEYPNSGCFNGTLASWLTLAPYRLYETPQLAESTHSFYYCDWFPTPGYPQYTNQFFDAYPQDIMNENSNEEWSPQDTDVSGSITRGTLNAKIEFDSLAMAMLYSHEWWIIPIPQQPMKITAMTSNNWYSILSGMTNNLAPYKPVYVTLDYHSQYVRTTRTAHMSSASYDTESGQVSAAMTGSTDIDTVVYVYGDGTNAVTASYGVVPPFSGSTSNVVGLLWPPTVKAAITKTNTVVVSWTNYLASSTNSNILALPNAPPACVLEQRPMGVTANWTVVTNPVTEAGNLSQVVISPSPATNRIYRLMSYGQQTQY